MSKKSKKKKGKPRNHPAKEARKTALIYASDVAEMKKAFKHLEKKEGWK